VHEEPRTRVTVDRLLDDLLEFYRQNRPKSLWWCEIVVKHLRGHFGYQNVGAVGTEAIKAYVAKRRAAKKPVGNSTLNRELALLRRAFNLGAQHEPPLVARVPRIADVAVFAYWTGCRKAKFSAFSGPR
jgi:hypothetical protein